MPGKTSIAEKELPGYEKFGDFKTMKKHEWIIRNVDNLLTENPNLSMEQLAKKLKTTVRKIQIAFDKREPSEIKKQGQMNREQLSNLIFKSAIGLGGSALLENPQRLIDSLQPIAESLLKNKPLLISGGGLLLFWEKIIKPRIADPKNDLSEIEVMVELLNTEIVKYGSLALLGITTAPFIWDKVVEIVNAIIAGIPIVKTAVEEKLEDLAENLAPANPELANEGYVFPTSYDILGGGGPHV